MTDSSKPETDPGEWELPRVAEHQAAEPRRVTLKPPDWTAPNSVSSLALERLLQSRATPHRTGNRAELASLRVRLREAREQGDVESEKNLSAQLAKKLVARGTRLEEATKLGRRSLLLGEDAELREELSNWFAGLGEVALAAGTLEPLTERVGDDVGRAHTWTRIAVLRGRAGDPVAAARALWSAADADRSDPVPLELFGALRLQLAETMPAARAARALVEAARRRRARGDGPGAHAVLLQAYEADPAYLPATEQLADSLFQSGRFQAADEVWRLAALSLAEPLPVHQRRLREALGTADVALALGAALDARADVTLDLGGIRTAVTLVNDGAGSVPVPHFDGLLGPAGLLPLLAARLEVAALQRRDAKALLALSRLVAGPLANPKRAAAHLATALCLAPDSPQVLLALEEYGRSSGDHQPLLDACFRITANAELPKEVLAARLSTLALTAASHAGEPRAALFALTRLAELGALTPELEELRGRLEAQDTPVPRFESWSQLSLAELRRAIDALAGRPAHAEAHLEALLEMKRRDPSDAEVDRAIERALCRLGAEERLERFWRDELQRAPDASAARLSLCRLLVEKGRASEALELLEAAHARPLGFEEAALFCVIASIHGGAETRALGLAKLADHARAPVRAILLGVASELLLAEGRSERALRLAEDACHSAPSAARPIVAYARASLGQRSRVAALSFERACEVVVPRVEWCRALLEAREDREQRLVALRRWLSLTPLDLEASRTLLLELIEAEDTEQLIKTLDWLLGQPVSLGEAFDVLERAIRCIFAKNPIAAKALCQRLLGVFGARDQRLNALIEDVASQLGEPWLLLALRERGLATSGRDPRAAQLELAELRAELGHLDLAYDALLQALEAGADVHQVRDRLAKLGEPESSDGVLSQLGSWARVQIEAEPRDAAQAHRDLGAALWDLAGDGPRAIEAWHRAAELDEEHGDERLARDLIAFCGYRAALPELVALAAHRPRERAAGLLVAAAALALSDGFKPEAVELAQRGLELAPERTDALAILERSLPADATSVLEKAYEIAGRSLLGVYGERALHYRAARQFERRRQHHVAFRHATLAFEAVPAEGVAFALMLRLAPLVGQEAEAARSIERVAQAQSDPARRATWLEHAARAAGAGPEGTRLRVEVLMRALLVRPEAETLDALGSALGELLAELPEERPKLQAAFDSSVRTLLRRLDDPELVGVAVTAARVAAEVFSSAGLTAGALRRGLQLNPASEAFEGVARFAAVLGSKPGSTRPLLDELSEACNREPLPHRQLLELGARLAERNASDLWPQLVVAIARKDPEDLAAVARAEAVCLEHPHLLEALRAVVDIQDRVSGALERAEQLSQSDPEHASKLLEELLTQQNLPADAFARALSQLEELHLSRRKYDVLEKLLTRVIETQRLETSTRVEAARRLAQLLSTQNAHAAALDAYALIDALAGMTETDLEHAAALARDGADPQREHELRVRLLELRSRDPERLLELLRLMQLAQELGQTQKAVEWAERARSIDASHAAASEVLEKDAERREDWARYVELAKARLQLSKEPAEKDVLALSDVVRFKQRRPRAAAQLLERFTSDGRGTVRLLERLAECWLEASDTLAAAKAYARGRALAKEAPVVGRLTELAARHFLAAGEAAEARAVLRADGLLPKTPALTELRAEVAERLGDRDEHAAALEELASVSMVPPKDRAGYLRRASELALEGGKAELALSRAQRAARIAPSDAKVQIFARLLEYRQRGVGSSQDALATITELRSLGDVDDASLASLKTFLLAEALKSRLGADAALKELHEAERRWPDQPLIALGLALHSGASAPKETVLGYYKRALHESVSVVRAPVEIALLAAAHAEEHGAPGSAIEVLEPFEASSEEVKRALLRLRTLPTAKTRLDLPSSKQEPKAPEFFVSVPPSSGFAGTAPAVQPATAAPTGHEQARAPVRSLADQPAVPRKPRPSLPRPSSEVRVQRPTTAQQAMTPPQGLPAAQSGEKASASRSAGALPISAPVGAPAASAAPSGAAPPGAPTTAPALAPPAPALTRTPPVAVSTPPTVSKAPPAKPATQVSGEFRAVDPNARATARLDRTVEIPAFDVPKEKPVRVEVKPDSRSLGQTWNSAKADELQAHARAALERRSARAPEPSTTPPTEGPPTHRDDELAPPTAASRSLAASSLAASSLSPTSVPAAATAPGSVTATSMTFPAASPLEQELLRALKAGSVEAGRELVRSLEGQPSRSHDLVAAQRALVQLTPGALEPVERLAEAAEADSDAAFAASLRHVLLTFTAKDRAPVAPPLSHQSEQPEVLARLLCGQPLPPALEALSLLSRNVPQLFRQSEPLDGTRRVSLDELSPLAQLVGSLQRLFGTNKTAILERPSAQPVTFRLVLGEPVTVLIEGRGNPATPEYRHYFGATLFGSRPELALSCGLPRERLQMVFEAILAAFGPPKQLSGDVARVAQLAERLWESVPARAQRRLQELCERPELVSLERALGAAQSAWVRAGLFASGDLGLALRDAARLAGLEPSAPYQPGELERSCGKHEILADVLRFATSLEFAALRWTEPRTLSAMHRSV